MELKVTVQQLEQLLNEQKRLVVEKLLGQPGYYNSESDAGTIRSLPINKDKFTEVGMSAKLPNDVDVLKRYIR